MILVLLNRRVRISRKALLFAPLLVGLTGIMLYRAGFGTVSVIVVLVPLYLAMWLAEKPLSRLIARIGYSIRWKFEIAIATVSLLFLSVSLISFGSMESMHQGLHGIQNLMDSQQGLPSASGGALSPSARSRVREAVDDLEDSRHGTLFSLTPLLGAVGVVAAAVLGAAMAWSVIDPVRAMGHAMRRIASGDFTQPVRVDNKDELGELSDHVNATAQELERLQAATLAEERARALRERMAHVTIAEEEERRRISRELHDGLGPSLAAIGNMVRVSQGFVRTQPAKAEEQLGNIAKSIKVHIREIRELIYDLRPLVLDQIGLEGAIRQQLDRLTHEIGAQASLSMTREATAEPAAEVTIYRVAQECLTNVLQHAEASQVQVSVEITPDGAQMHVSDNGRGFDPAMVSPADTGKGVGLVSMQERAERIGGSLSIRSSPGSGCEVDLYIPCLSA
jgi:signal transduction histidine kinase